MSWWDRARLIVDEHLLQHHVALDARCAPVSGARSDRDLDPEIVGL
jgi:hypothetical protein